MRTRRALTCFSPDHDPRLLPAGPSAVPRARSHAHRPAGGTRPRASPEGARLPASPPRGSAPSAAPPVPAEGRRDRSTASPSGPGPVRPPERSTKDLATPRSCNPGKGQQPRRCEPWTGQPQEVGRSGPARAGPARPAEDKAGGAAGAGPAPGVAPNRRLRGFHADRSPAAAKFTLSPESGPGLPPRPSAPRPGPRSRPGPGPRPGY